MPPSFLDEFMWTYFWFWRGRRSCRWLPFTSLLHPVPLGLRRGWVQAQGGRGLGGVRVAGHGGGTVSGGQALEISVVFFSWEGCGVGGWVVVAVVCGGGGGGW